MTLGADPFGLAGPGCDPRKSVEGRLNGAAFQARIMIPEYNARLADHFGVDIDTLGVAFPFRSFGVTVDFETPVELVTHDAHRRLDEGLRTLVGRFGPVLLRNVCMPGGWPPLRAKKRVLIA